MKLPLQRTRLLAGGALLLCAGILVWWNMRQLDPLHRAPSSANRSLADYYQAGQQLKQTPTTAHTTTATFLAVGDISLSRAVAAAIQKRQDPSYPFARIRELLHSTDFNFGNLETPFSSSDSFTAANTLIFNAPKANVAGLVDANFKVLTLANNHAYDQGLDGVRTTRRVLTEHAILHTGTGETLEEAWAPAVHEANGIKIGFIGASYASINDGGKTTNNHVARIEDTDRLTAQVSRFKSLVDFVVVSMHAGVEYTRKPTQAQIDFAHAAVEAGADMVIGHHAHWVQEKELYCGKYNAASTEAAAASHSSRTLPNPAGDVIRSPLTHSDTFAVSDRSNCKWIYYGLGNFVFDQSWSEQTKKGLALKITLSKTTVPNGTVGAGTADLQPAGPQVGTRLVSIQEIPIYIENNCCPIPFPSPTP